MTNTYSKSKNTEELGSVAEVGIYCSDYNIGVLGEEAPNRARPPGFVRGLGERSKYAEPEAYQQVLSYLRSVLGVSLYRLSFLIGLPHPYRIYRWYRGQARMSSLYLARAIRLLEIHSEGYPIDRVQSIDWVTGQAWALPVREAPPADRTVAPREWTDPSGEVLSVDGGVSTPAEMAETEVVASTPVATGGCQVCDNPETRHGRECCSCWKVIEDLAACEHDAQTGEGADIASSVGEGGMTSTPRRIPSEAGEVEAHQIQKEQLQVAKALVEDVKAKVPSPLELVAFADHPDVEKAPGHKRIAVATNLWHKEQLAALIPLELLRSLDDSNPLAEEPIPND